MRDTYMHVWKIPNDDYYAFMTKYGMSGLRLTLYRLFGAGCRYMIRTRGNAHKIIVKSNLTEHRFNPSVGEIIQRGLWDNVEKKVGERVTFLVDYVEKDKSGNYLMTYDENEVFKIFRNKQINYGIKAESFTLHTIRKISIKGCPYFSYRMHITATVTDDVCYNRMLKNGIGRNRSHGSGLVSVGLDPDD